MTEELKQIADLLIDIAEEMETEEWDEDDWCIHALLIDSQISHLKQIREEMSKHYD